MSSLPSSSTASPPPPWGVWHLDSDFLANLNAWTAKHPDKNRLPTVLKAISDAIDSSEDWLDYIPESPFPAKSLVTALTALLNFGVVGNYFPMLDHDASQHVESRTGKIRSQGVRPRGCGLDHSNRGCIQRRRRRSICREGLGQSSGNAVSTRDTD
jgi:hypothetical protein